jgi:hypothetical protein
MRRPVGVKPFFCGWDKFIVLPDLNAILGTPSYFCRHPSIRTLM